MDGIDQHDHLTKYIFIVAFLAVIYMSFVIVKPFIASILAGAIIAYVFYPLYKRTLNRVKRKSLAAFLVSIFIVIIVTLPFVFLINDLSGEANYVYVRVKQTFSTGSVLGLQCPDGPTTLPCRIQTKVQELFEYEQIHFYVQDGIQRFTEWVLNTTSNIIFSLPRIFLAIFISFFTSYYLFKDGKKLMMKIKQLLPFKKSHQDQVILKFEEVTHAVIYGTIIIALIQGMLGAFGFLIVGIPSPILWGILMSLFALIPFVGTPIVWAPAALLLLINGYTTGNTILMLKGAGLFLYGALVISMIDNVLKPKIIGDRANIHPVLIMLGVLGGLYFFGFIGFIIGPLVLALLVTFLDIYQQERASL